MPVTRRQLAADMARILGWDVRSADQALAAFEIAVTDRLETGEDVSLHGFAKFHYVRTQPRIGRNPQDGTPVPIAPRWKIRLRPGKTLADIAAARPDPQPVVEPISP